MALKCGINPMLLLLRVLLVWFLFNQEMFQRWRLSATQPPSQMERARRRESRKGLELQSGGDSRRKFPFQARLLWSRQPREDQRLPGTRIPGGCSSVHLRGRFDLFSTNSKPKNHQ